MFTMALTSVTLKSPTVDEGSKLAMGYSYLKTFDLRFQGLHKHPRLAEAWVALPLLLDPRVPEPSEVIGWDVSRSYFEFVPNFYYRNPDVVRYTLVGRVQTLLLGTLLGALVYRLASDWFGGRAGLFACLVCCLSPNVLAHSALMTNDIAATLACAAALSGLQGLLRKPTIARMSLFGVMLGAALLVKYSCIVLIPAAGIVLLMAVFRRHWRWTVWPGISRRAAALRGAGLGVVVLVIAGLIVWAGFGFELRALSYIDLPVRVPAASVVDNVIRLTQLGQGKPAFLLGQRWGGGRWYYFPAAILFKTPLPTLGLVAVGLVASIRQRRFVDQAPLWVFPAIYFVATVAGGRNIGYRYLLPAVPFALVFAGSAVSLLETRLPGPWGKASALAIGVFYCALATGMFPDYLAYFNVVAAGPGNGYRVLVDSNLDWGQDLPQLRMYMERKGIEEVWLSLFGLTDPASYGVRYRDLPDWEDKDISPDYHYMNPDPGVYAIGATLLQGVYLPNTSTFDWFRRREPIAKIGYSMLVYEVEPDPTSPGWLGMCYAPDPPLTPADVAAAFGRGDLRVVYFDCTNTWVLPGPAHPAWYVVPAQAGGARSMASRWLAEGRTDFEQRTLDDQPEFALTRLISQPAAMSGVVGRALALPHGAVPGRDADGGVWLQAPIYLHGPADSLGYAVLTAEPQTAGELVVETLWRARSAVTDTIPSVFAHLTHEAGVVWGVADGLGYNAVQWDVGDVLVQRHAFSLPSGMPAGRYWIAAGMYDGLSGVRYRVPLEDGQVDALWFGPVQIRDGR
jgi:hypothetical protein